jgi:hypothetical protein
MRKSNFALRLQPSLLEEARRLAQAEGVALNQLINVAVAEKLSALRTKATSSSVRRGPTFQRRTCCWIRTIGANRPYPCCGRRSVSRPPRPASPSDWRRITICG